MKYSLTLRMGDRQKKSGSQRSGGSHSSSSQSHSTAHDPWAAEEARVSREAEAGAAVLASEAQAQLPPLVRGAPPALGPSRSRGEGSSGRSRRSQAGMEAVYPDYAARGAPPGSGPAHSNAHVAASSGAAREPHTRDDSIVKPGEGTSRRLPIAMNWSETDLRSRDRDAGMRDDQEYGTLGPLPSGMASGGSLRQGAVMGQGLGRGGAAGEERGWEGEGRGDRARGREGDLEHDELDEEDEEEMIRRRFSISTPSEWVGPLSMQGGGPKKNISRGVSFSYNDTNPFGDVVGEPGGPMSAAMAARYARGIHESHSSSRVERLLRARMRRSSGQLSENSEAPGPAPAHPQQAHPQSQQQPQQQQHLQQQQQQRVTSPRGGPPSRSGLSLNPLGPASNPMPPSVSTGKLQYSPPGAPPLGHSGQHGGAHSGVPGMSMATESLGLESREPSYESFSDAPLSTMGMPAGAPVPASPQRLLIVANRLPVRAATSKDGGWALELSSGGLVSALLGVKQNYETCWIGWPGLYLRNEEQQNALKEALEAKGCVPVFLSETIVDNYYNGYCNNVLWPLLHYIGLPQEDRLSATVSMQTQYAAYREANKMFADVVGERYREGDVVWVHDYHLMLLPSFLKKKSPRMKVGWFLHTPFPSSEVFRTLPLRAEILQAVLAADLVGFHTYDYARHFVSACTRILGLEGTFEGVEDHGRLTRVAAFPIGIDPERFIAALESPVVKTHIAELRARFSGRKVMLGVDRLDMIKGIPQKLVAYEKFLEENPKWRDKVLLVQIAVPSRTDVPEYQRLTGQVHEIVGRINGRFGTLTTVPIHHLDRSLAFHELCALYAITDVALVTSLRDGMNLVSYEYVACQNQNKGVLVLSESLGAGALLVNPWNIADVSSAIEDALNMSEEDRIERHRHNFMHVTTHTAQAWADTFVSELNDTVVEAELRTLRVPPLLPEVTASRKFHAASNRLLILGYNSALTAHAEAPRRRGPDQIKEMKLKLHSAIASVLRRLASDPHTTIIIMSGSERAVLDEAFSEFPLWLAAENGIFMRHTSGEWITTMPEHLNMDWFESVQLVFDYFCERTPRSYVETRETSLVWNYKYADVEFGRVQARDMLQHLWTGPISNAAVDVIQGGKSVEVRPVGISKGAAMERILGEIAHQKPIATPFDFVFVLGHFLSKDEDIYTFFEPFMPFEPSGSAGPMRPGEKGHEKKLLGSQSAERPSPAKHRTSAAATAAAGGRVSVGAEPRAEAQEQGAKGAGGAAGGITEAVTAAAAAAAAAEAASEARERTPGSGPMSIPASTPPPQGSALVTASGPSSGSGSSSRFVCPDPTGPAGLASSGSGRWHGKRGGGLKHVSSATSLQLSSSPAEGSTGSGSVQGGAGAFAGSGSGSGHQTVGGSGSGSGGGGGVVGGGGGAAGAGSVQEDPSVSSRSSGEYCPIVDVHEDSYFSCAVGRKRSCARFALLSSDDVVRVLESFCPDQHVRSRPIFQSYG